MAKYTDLLITEDDFTLDVAGNPSQASDRACIAQDICHMIRETGLLVELIANRDENTTEANKIKIAMAVDEDERIIPGTTKITQPEPGVFYITAETADFGPIQAEVTTLA